MSDKDIYLDLQERTVIRKGLKKLRDDGLVPAVLHDHGKASLHVMSDAKQLLKVYHEAGKHHPVELKLGDRVDMAIIKDVDFDPVKLGMRHVVFQAIRKDEKVETEVPIVLEGEIPAEKTGLMVISNISEVQIQALPKDLPDDIKVDATVLAEIGDKVTVADLVVPSGVEILTDPETMIATVEETKAQISEEAEETEEEAEGEGGETEEGEKPAEGESEKPQE